MMQYTKGNLLDAPVEALVNTVNTVGVMGKGVALMFKEAYPENFKTYETACKQKQVHVGRMFVTETMKLDGPRWIINFPTKAHWRFPSKIEWITQGLNDLHQVIQDRGIHSIALPPLGAGNGGLDWQEVRAEIARVLGDLEEVDITVYEPTEKYQNVAKCTGVEQLTPARTLIAEIVRRYWVLGNVCTYLEVQKLGWFLERAANTLSIDDPLKLGFQANKYGPYSDRLRHLLTGLDGTYLHCDKRLADASPSDTIWFDEERRRVVELYLRQEQAGDLRRILDYTQQRIDGFESPLGMELLATIDWLIERMRVAPVVGEIRSALGHWPAGREAAERKLRLFDERSIDLALKQLALTIAV